jgi:UDP-3-O-[3-hydroxymyristoyl] glucosamine N-acyltransferase
MVSQKSIDLLTQLVTQTQANLDAYTEVLNALNTQLTTDQSQIDQAVSDQVTAALAPVQTAVSSTLTSLANAKTIDSLPSTSDSVVLVDVPADKTPTDAPALVVADNGEPATPAV